MQRIILFLLVLTTALITFDSCSRSSSKSSSGSKSSGSSSSSTADANGIKFESGSLESVLSKAKQTGKPIFIDMYASWCGPCREMEKKVFTNKEVAKFFNTNFISYRIDGEKGKGPDLVKRFRVMGYPSLIYLAPDGQLIHNEMGALSTQELIRQGRQALMKMH